MLLVLSSCADYLEQDSGELNTLDKIFTSEVDTKKWYSRMYSDDFMVQEMHYSGQIPYFWCTDEAAYVMESNIRNISEGLMSPDNYYGYTGYNLYFFVRYYQAIRHINIFLENLEIGRAIDVLRWGNLNVVQNTQKQFSCVRTIIISYFVCMVLFQ